MQKLCTPSLTAERYCRFPTKERCVMCDQPFSGQEASVECRIAWREEVGPREGCWGGEGGDHGGCKEGPWEAFQFGLRWGGDEEDRSVEGSVE